MESLATGLFAITAGFTVSGIAANSYRLWARRPESPAAHTFRLAVMAVAGPSVIFETAVRGYVAGEWTRSAFWLAVSGATYWSLVLGLFVLDIAIHM